MSVSSLSKSGISAFLTRIEKGYALRSFDDEMVQMLDKCLQSAKGHIIGISGAGGVGKSSLISSLLNRFIATGQRVAVLAVDPSSQISGGAILGDRVRFTVDADPCHYFIRSCAARSQLGGVAESTFASAIFLSAHYDVVLVETVGVGQSEIDIRKLADTVLMAIQPGSGDSIQYIKAGIIEIPDVFCVTKADFGDKARRTLSDLQAGLSMRSGREPLPAYLISAQTGEGIEELCAFFHRHFIALQAQNIAGIRQNNLTYWIKSYIKTEYGRRGMEHIPAAFFLDNSFQGMMKAVQFLKKSTKN